MAFASVFVVITNGAAAMVMLSETSGVCGGVLWSVAFTLKSISPAAVGVPEMTPLVPFRLSPAGKVPELMLQVTGAVPPVEASVAV